ncbi:unnamed protein product [Bursaphelenchus okinawaensis]|uniref:Peptidase_M13 domain-containing protein n=1 Tax=Bursaphelenchus okinawaensis TaxID=465554 RepID=A0A811K5Q7_9BILA|nr:unnamed protein product [Bursaphelenchus okinawaensis]CAG9091951.1 unnamed protein product [Bursaphelenchus okinawaensis]
MASNTEKAKTIAHFLILAVSLALLAISIITLVNVNNNNKDHARTTPGTTNPSNDQTTTPRPHTNMNIPKPKVVDSVSQPDLFKAYKSFSDDLTASMNFSYDPCNNFYEYVCGNKPRSSFDMADEHNAKMILKGLDRSGNRPYAEKTKQALKICVDSYKNKEKIHKNGEAIKEVVEFAKTIGLKIPIFGDKVTSIGPTELGELVARISAHFHVKTFVDYHVDTNWPHPTPEKKHHTPAYRLFIDQPVTYYPELFYRKIFDDIKPIYAKKIKNVVLQAAKLVGVDVNVHDLEEDIEEVIKLEKEMAVDVNTDKVTRRDYGRSFNVVTSESLVSYFIQYTDFLTEVSRIETSGEIHSLVSNLKYEVINMEPDGLFKLADYWWDKDDKFIYNYLFYRILLQFEEYFPEQTEKTVIDTLLSKKYGHKWGLEDDLKHKLPQFQRKDFGEDNIEEKCLEKIVVLMPEATSRLFVDGVFLNQKEKEIMKKQASQLVSNVLTGFQAQIDELNWMSQESKESAYEKIRYLTRNIAYPEWVDDDEKLNEFHKNLYLMDDMDYKDFEDTFFRWRREKEWEQLLMNSTDRSYFGRSAVMVNAWYQGGRNSITMPFGIFQRPFYDPNYPAAINYGAVGVVAGHELTHGFDDQGVQWDGYGRLRTWMDDRTREGFKRMAQCVIDQYSNFKPLDDLNINGQMTQGDDIADNGGIRAAYNAFQAHMELLGQDPRLPGLLQGFTPEQMFFIANARVSCEEEVPDDVMRKFLLTDLHSPSKYRVLGPLQNFPAFRTAFNCPIGSTYAPRQHCNVWASKVEAGRGIPIVPNFAPTVNIEKPVVNNTKQYKYIASGWTENLYLDGDTCKDFHSYSCGGKSDFSPLEEAKNKLQKAVVDKINGEELEFPQSLAQSMFKTCGSTKTTNGTAFVGMFKYFEMVLGIPFLPANATINPTDLGRALSILSSGYGVNVLYSVDVRPSVGNRNLEPGYKLQLGAPDFLYDKSVYLTGDTSLSLASNLALAVVRKLAAVLPDLQQRDYDEVVAAVEQALYFEHPLGVVFNRNNSRVEGQKEYKLQELYDTEYGKLLRIEFLLKDLNGIYKSLHNSSFITEDTKIVVENEKVFEALTSFYKRIYSSQENTVNFVNHLYIRLFLRYQHLIPELFDVSSDIVPVYKERLYDDIDKNVEKTCYHEVKDTLPPLFANIAVNNVYENVDEFKKVRSEVGTVVQTVVQSFEGLINGLSWMPVEDRDKFVRKLRGIARNIGVNDEWLDNDKLKEYYKEFLEPNTMSNHPKALDSLQQNILLSLLSNTSAPLPFPNTLDYWFLSSNLFKRVQSLNKLSLTQVRRSEIAENHNLKVTVDYERNSINIPLEYLQSPYYSKDNPQEFTFSTLGVEIGRALGQLVSTEGLQYNEKGELEYWLGQDTLKKLVDKYEHLSDYFENKEVLVRVMKDLFVVENTAILVAKKALDEWHSVYGNDGSLPDEFMRLLTPEQLFYYGYSQGFCKDVQQRAYVYGNKQLLNKLVDNSRDFQKSYNCKQEKNATVVDLWESPADPIVGVPDLPKLAPSLNINKNSPVSNNKNYEEVVHHLSTSLDVRQDPCNNFYEYTCGRLSEETVFERVEQNNLARLYSEIMKPMAPDDIQPVQMQKEFVRTCVNYHENPMQDTKPAKEITEKLFSYSKMHFGLLDGVFNYTTPSPLETGKALGYLYGTFGTNSIVTLSPIVNLKHPDQGYTFHLKPGGLITERMLRNNYPDTAVIESLTTHILKYISSQRKVNIRDFARVKAAAQGYYGLEKGLFDVIKEKKELRNVTEKYERVTIGELQKWSYSIDIVGMFEGALNEYKQIVPKFQSKHQEVYVDDLEFLKKLLAKFDQLTLDWDDELSNYLHLVAIYTDNGKYLPREVNWDNNKIINEKLTSLLEKTESETKIGDDVEIARNCVHEAINLFDQVANYQFVKTSLPKKKQQLELKRNVAKVVDSVLLGYKSMLESLPWLSSESKNQAYAKLSYLAKNLGYDNTTDSKKALLKYYDTLYFFDILSYDETIFRVNNYKQQKLIEKLTSSEARREGFGINIFNPVLSYDEATNGLSVPLGVLQSPLFDENWPEAVKYGAFGSLIGENVLYGFNDVGSQYDYIGSPNSWLDKTYLKEYKKMAKCVAHQYSNFCESINGTKQCVDGKAKQHDILANIGGLQAAFRAYRNSIGVTGFDDALPNELMGQYTEDQLFFLSYAKVYCRKQDKQFNEDKYKVMGALQNFPAFKEAFKCQASVYAPSDHCNVWVNDIEPSLALPSTTTTLPPLNIPLPQKSEDNDDSQEVIQLFHSTLDIEQSPCDNFYGYVCNNVPDKFETEEQKATRTSSQHVVDTLENENIEFAKKHIIKSYYEACKDTKSSDKHRQQYMIDLVDSFKNDIGSGYPLFAVNGTDIDKNFAEKAVATLFTKYDTATLFSITVEPNLETMVPYPSYLLNFDDDILMFPQEWHQERYRAGMKKYINQQVCDVLKQYIEVIDFKNVIDIDEAAESIVYIEAVLSKFVKRRDQKEILQERQIVNTVNILPEDYKKFDWVLFFDHLLKSAPSAVRSKILAKENGTETLSKEYKISVTNWDGLIDILKLLEDKTYSITRENLVDYFYFRLLWSQKDILSPAPQGQQLSLDCALESRKFSRLSDRAYFESSTILFDNIKNKISALTNTILNVFVTHIRRVSWLRDDAKATVIGKINNIGVNVVGDVAAIQDGAIEEYFKDYDSASEGFMDKRAYLNEFNKGKQFEKLLQDSVRKEFEGSAVDVAIKYDHFTNSLTIPAAVLESYFNPKYPKAVNFGAIGTRIAHKLAHSLDKLGIQLDARGKYDDWSRDYAAFGNLLDCLKKQYGEFCPLRNTTFAQKCLDLDEIVDENIADNIASHVTLTAYQLWKDHDGEDARLNDNLLGQFTADQSFYLSYARQFCENPESGIDVFTKLTFEDIVPSEFRVQGVLQNHRAFRSAFNCPADSKYSGQATCDVFTGGNGISSQQTSLNIREKKKIDNSYPESQVKAYKLAAENFNYSMDLTADPCNDFYKYSCGNYKKAKSFTILREQNYRNQAKAIMNIDLEKEPSTALKKLRQYYDQCVETYENYEDRIKEGKQINEAINQLQQVLGNNNKPTMFYKKALLPATASLEKAIAYLQVTEGIQTLITESVEVDGEEGAAEPGKKPELLYMDEPTLLLGKSYYQVAPWKDQEAKYKKGMLNTLKKALFVYKKHDPNADADEERLHKFVEEFTDLEVKLAREAYATDETKRRQYTCTKYNMADLNVKFPGVKTTVYITELKSLSGIGATGNTVAFKWPETYKKLWSDINGKRLASHETIVNYLYMRLIMAKAALIPTLEAMKTSELKITFNSTELSKTTSEDIAQKCGMQTQMKMMYANGRAFADYLYPTVTDKENARKDVEKMIDNIRLQFQGMLDELTWLDPSSKQFLTDKVTNLQKNILYPSFSLDNANLDKYYSSFSVGKDFFETTKRLNVHLKYHEMFYTTSEGKNYRDDFIQWPGTVNAWYEPFYNSLTIPEGIVQSPFYNPEWPTSLNYGGLGVVTGHELSHAFDDEGIQWDGIGRRSKTGLSPEAYKRFNEMAQCIVDEYGSFEPLDPAKYSPSHLNGANTQGENIADNGGIHAAYRAYKNHIQLNGQEPQLPHDVLQYLTHDQLFFLSFAQVWCQEDATPEELHKQILTDPHSPSVYRVMGTVQNYPAFREAFNCPANAQYTPLKHCSVWVPEGQLV